MTKSSPEDKLVSVMESTGLINVVEQASTEASISILFRVTSPSKRREIPKQWSLCMMMMLEEAASAEDSDQPWELMVAKQYLIRGDRLVYGWMLVLQSEYLSTAVRDLSRALKLFKNSSRFAALVTTPEPPKVLVQNAIPTHLRSDGNNHSDVPGVGVPCEFDEFGEIASAPLIGASQDRNRIKKGKGAQLFQYKTKRAKRR